MTILRDISVVYTMANILILFFVLMEFRYPMKKTIILSGLFFVPLVILNIWSLVTFGPSAMAQGLYVTLILPSIVFFYILSQYRDGRFFYSFFLICDLNTDVTILTYLLDHYLPGDIYVVMLISRLILFPLMNISIYRWIRRSYLEVQHSVEKGWMGFAVTAAIFDIITVQIFSYPSMIDSRPEYILPLIMLIVLTPLINWTMFVALNNQKALYEAKEREQLLNLQSSSVARHAEQVSQTEKLLAIQRHDLRHRFRTIAAMIEKGESGEVLNYINSVEDSLEHATTKIWCENPVLNAVFSTYFEIADKYNIRIESELDIPKKLPVDVAELSTVFANALENAIEAVRELEDDKKVIRCRCIRYPKLMFRVSNPYDGNIKFNSDGVPMSKDRSGGIGTRSIAAYCERHGAWVDYIAKDNWFTIQITQP